MFFIFFIYSLVILTSTLGYGLIILKFLKFKEANIGLVGILGLFFLSIIASYTYLFFAHNYIHNSIVVFFGLVSFLFLKKKILKDFKYLIILFFLLFIFLIISKTNEDFGYYHLPNSIQFAQQKLQFGLGNLNHGFKHISSIFQLMSLHYLPLVEFYLFNLTNFLFFIFFLAFILKEIFKKSSKNLNFSNILLSLIFILFITKFSRLAEYGSDISGQIIISIYFFYIFELILNSKLKVNEQIEFLKLSLILILFAITLKFIHIIYLLLVLLSFILIKKKFQFIVKILNINFLTISLLSIIIFIFLNFTSTGCLIYPVEELCFSNNFDWALKSKTVNYLNFHYELWSKAGRGPNFSVDNPENYIQSLNWLSNWISLYFIGKFTDFILVTLIIIITFSCFFLKEIFKTSENLKKSYTKYYLLYFTLLLIFFIWFFNFPTLRYAGFIIAFLTLIFPFCILINEKINLSLKNNLKKLLILFILSYSIFLFKNIIRLNNELKIIDENQHHNFKNFPFFWIENTLPEKIKLNNLTLQKVKGKCWATPSICVRNFDNLKIISKNGYIFYIKENEQ